MSECNSQLNTPERDTKNVELQNFSVGITETLQKEVAVRAHDINEAERIAADTYICGEPVLTADDCIGVSFRAALLLPENTGDPVERVYTYTFREVIAGKISIKSICEPDAEEIEAAIFDGGADYYNTAFEDISLNKVDQ